MPLYDLKLSLSLVSVDLLFNKIELVKVFYFLLLRGQIVVHTCLFLFNDVCLQCSDTASSKCKVHHIACNSIELRKFTCKGCRWCLLTEVGLGTVRSRRVPSVQSCSWRATLQENLALALIKHTLTSYSVYLG